MLSKQAVLKNKKKWFDEVIDKYKSKLQVFASKSPHLEWR